MRPILSLISNFKVGSDRFLRSSFAKTSTDVTSTSISGATFGTKLGTTSGAVLTEPNNSLVESSISQLFVPFLKKTPSAFLSLAFIYLAACNFDPLWIVHDAETEAVTVPGAPGQLQTCIPNSSRPNGSSNGQTNLASQQSDSEGRTSARNRQLGPADKSSYPSSKSVSGNENLCIPSMELSLRDRPHERPHATAPPSPAFS